MQTPVVTSLRPIAARPGWMSICVDRRRVGSLTLQACDRLAIAVGVPWTPALAGAFAQEAEYLAALHAAAALVRQADQAAARLAERLRAKGYADAAIERAIADLREQGIIDDARHAHAIARLEVQRHRAQPIIEAKLIHRGHDSTAAAEAARDAIRGLDPVDQAERLIRSRLAVSARSASDPDRVRRRLYALLLRNGFDDDTARAALRRVLGEEPGDHPTD